MESDKKKIIRYNIFGAFIITISIIIIAISSSYAYFLSKITEVNSGNKGVTVTSGNLTMAFTTSQVFSQLKSTLIDAASGTNDETINLNTLKSKAGNTTFSIGVDATSGVKSAKYALYLTNISVSNNLKNKYLKYALYTGTTLKASGSFADYVNGTNIPLLSEQTASTTATTYILYVWLENDPNVIQSQDCGGVYTSCVDLREGTLSFKVGFSATT